MVQISQIATVYQPTSNPAPPVPFSGKIAPAFSLLGVIYLIGVILILSAARWRVRAYSITSSKDSNQKLSRSLQADIPCQSCRFFSADTHHLRCAVHPKIVMTEEALECSDYCSAQATVLPKQQ